MNSRISSILLVMILLTSCKNQEDKVTPPSSVKIANTYRNENYIIEAEVLMNLLGKTNLKLIDFRKKEDFEKRHIPGAVRIYRPDIEDSSYPYKGMMAPKATLEALLSRVGIKNGDTLIVYDDRGGSDAARLWWVLQNHDYTSVKLLNGGLKAWIAANGTLTDTEGIPLPSNFILPAESSMRFIIEREELKSSLSKENGPLILDVRTNDEYSGKRQKLGATKAGRIPKSKLIDWSRAIDYHGTHKFRSYEELEALYGKLGVSEEGAIITYCHTGVRSAHTTFVLSVLLGYSNVKNYDGSWSEWSYYEDLPIEKDSITVILQ